MEEVDAGGTDDAGQDAGGCSATDAAAPADDAGPRNPACTGTPCGGDPTGTWEIVAACAFGSGDASFLQCPTGTVTVDEFDVTGTWEIAADGTVTVNVSEHASAYAYLELACYDRSNCSQVEALGAAADIVLDCAPAGPVGDRCQAEGCFCHVTLDRPELALTGNITTDATAGTFTLTQGTEVIDGEYCVMGDELWLSGVRFGSVQYRYRFQRAAGP